MPESRGAGWRFRAAINLRKGVANIVGFSLAESRCRGRVLATNRWTAKKRAAVKENQSMYGKRGRCPDCDSGLLTGDGRCSHCHGSGTNLNLASDVPQCLFCRGTGVCQTCGGAGTTQMGEEYGESGIQKLFED